MKGSKEAGSQKIEQEKSMTPNSKIQWDRKKKASKIVGNDALIIFLGINL